MRRGGLCCTNGRGAGTTRWRTGPRPSTGTRRRCAATPTATRSSPPSRICAGTGLTPPTSAPGPGSPLPTSAPGLDVQALDQLVTNHMLSAADEAALVNQAKVAPQPLGSTASTGSTACARSTPPHCGPCVEYPFTHADGPVPWAKRRPLQAGVRRAVSGRGALDGTGPAGLSDARAMRRVRPPGRTPRGRWRRARGRGRVAQRTAACGVGFAPARGRRGRRVAPAALRLEAQEVRSASGARGACASRPRYALRLRAPELRCAALLSAPKPLYSRRTPRALSAAQCRAAPYSAVQRSAAQRQPGAHG